MKPFGTEADWEHLALDELGELGWEPKAGKVIAPGSGERVSWDSLVITHRLRDALLRLNPDVPPHYLDQAMAEILAVRSGDAVTENHRMHGILVGGYSGLSYVDDEGVQRSPTIHVVSANPDRNDWLAANQVRLVDRDHDRRFDIVLYCNGLPVGIVEVKKGGAHQADFSAAHAQLHTYVHEFPAEFRFALLTIATDGVISAYGTPFTPLNHFAPWNVDDDGRPVEPGEVQPDGSTPTSLSLLLFGVCNLERFLQLQRHFTAFHVNSDDGTLTKRIAKPHQYFAVTKAVGSTVDAVRGDGRAGVVWHTQGSGKSMEMELYTYALSQRPELANPTVVVITDRTDLDGQLFSAFARSQLLPSTPIQITTRKQLREVLTETRSGGIYFTTLQKFGRTLGERDAGEAHPLLTDRSNVVVIVDEAHRSHYDDLDGYARHLRDALPRATLIAFTGTPIAKADHDTRAVFGDVIDVYDLTRAVKDGATVPVYFEPRLIRVALDEGVTPDDLDAAADEITVGLDDVERARIERSVANLNRLYGAPDRIEALVDDLLAHWDARADAMTAFIGTRGKAMIVCVTREVCVRVYEAIVRRRPDWADPADDKGRVKVVFSGVPSDPAAYQPHIRRPSQERAVKERAARDDDELELIIVKDMLLTGFDSPALHTLYLDRPMRDALLMQTLARVNRTFRGKRDGLLVAYAPIADSLEHALGEYTVDDQHERPVGRHIAEAADAMLDVLLELEGCLGGFPWRSRLAVGTPRAHVETVISAANYLRSPTNNAAGEDGAEPVALRFRRLAGQLTRLWALARGKESLTSAQQRDVGFFEQVRVAMAKLDAEARRGRGEPIPEDIQLLLGKVIDDSTDAGEILDIYAAAGLPRMSLAELTPTAMDAMRAAAKHADRAHLAIEQIRNLLMSEAGSMVAGSLVRGRAFSERIDELMRRYTNQQLTAAEVMAALIELAQEVTADAARGAKFTPPLGDDELAVFDALEANDSARLLQGEDTLAQIARELVAVMRRDIRTDWTVRDDVKAKLRSSIKRLLVKYDYPPDQQQGAISLVMEQMEALAPRYAAERKAEGHAPS
jgi:type I restriction enzyme R subunit